jgi:hypothetical protein
VKNQVMSRPLHLIVGIQPRVEMSTVADTMDRRTTSQRLGPVIVGVSNRRTEVKWGAIAEAVAFVESTACQRADA